MIPKKLLGKFGEKNACKYLEELGYKIFEENYHCRYGEIDIIAGKNNTVYFFEVKTRQIKCFGEPEEAIDNSKLKKIFLTARHYISSNNLYGMDFRFDAISLIVRNNKISVRHIEDIIQ